MNIDYAVTDEQLRAFGISQRTIDLSRASYFRLYADWRWEKQDLDLSYVANVNEAKDRVALAALAINNPTEKYIRFPPYGQARIGLVRHDEVLAAEGAA